MQTNQGRASNRKEYYRNYDRNSVSKGFQRENLNEIDSVKGEASTNADIDPYINMDRDERENTAESETRTGRYFGIGSQGFRRSDERLFEDVHLALERNNDIDASDVELEVTDGVVTLSGLVDTFEAKRTSERVVTAVPGVKDIANKLQIRDSFGSEF